MIALEFKPGTPGNFHYNRTFGTGEFDSRINTNGYRPITLIPDKVADDIRFLALQRSLIMDNASLERVVREVYAWAAKHENLWNE